MTTRAEFFDRIRGEMRKTTGSFTARVSERPSRSVDAADLVRRQLAERWRETAERFQLELERVGGVFHRVPSVAAVPSLVATLARERKTDHVVAWHAGGIGAELDEGLIAQSLRVDGAPHAGGDADRQAMRGAAAVAGLGVTGVDLAIAEMGTMVLRSGPGRPRSTSLLPPCHVAVFDPTVLVETLEQAGIFLEAWHANADLDGAMINFITGPSRTADIELTLTRGVHGPKEVHAVFVEGGLGG